VSNSDTKTIKRQKTRASHVKDVLQQLPPRTYFKKKTNTVTYVTNQLRRIHAEYSTLHYTSVRNCRYCMIEINKWWKFNPEVLKAHGIESSSPTTLQALLLKERSTVFTLLKKITKLESKVHKHSISLTNTENSKNDDFFLALYQLLSYLKQNDTGVFFDSSTTSIIDDAYHNKIIIVEKARLKPYSNWLKSNRNKLELLNKCKEH